MAGETICIKIRKLIFFHVFDHLILLDFNDFLGGLMVVCSQLHILNDSLENIQELALMEMDKEKITASSYSADMDKMLIRKLEECVKHHICILK